MADLKVLGLIGARSGSKGVPDKNIKELGGKPLMAWIIEAASKANSINRVIVSTDSPEYATVARKYGAETPFLRPQELSNDMSVDSEYIDHALDWLLENEGYTPDIVLRLLATSPLQEADDIDQCVAELTRDPKAHSSVVIAEASQHPHKALKIDGDKLVSYISGEGRDVTPLVRQGYEKAFFRANVVASRIDTIRKHSSLTGENVKYHIIPQERAVDIDSPLDFFLAEQLLIKLGKV